MERVSETFLAESPPHGERQAEIIAEHGSGALRRRMAFRLKPARECPLQHNFMPLFSQRSRVV